MRILNTRTRMTIGLVCMLTTVLMFALWLGLLPDRRREVLEGRATLCEALAVNASSLVTRQDLRRLDLMLYTIVTRKPDLLSAGVRRADGKLLCEVADHGRLWQPLTGDRSNESQVQVPIRQGDAKDSSKWGSVEIRFRPLSRPGWIGYLTDPHVQLIAFVAVASLVLVYIYLGTVLKQVDASKAVPGHVRSALDTLAEGLLLLDGKQRIVFANDAFATKLGLPTQRLLGKRISELPWCSEDCSQPVTSFPWTGLFDDGRQGASQLMRLCPDGAERRTVLVNCCPITTPGGKIRGALISLDDVTELEEQKVELRRAKADAEGANRAKSEFLANMSHEIRTPMNAILGFTDVLRRGLAETDEDHQEYLDTIHRSGTFLLELINDILDLSKIESGRLEVERTSCSPHKVISDVVEVLGVRAGEKGLTSEFSADHSIPETVQSDPTRLRQILTNLVGNAMKFTHEGGVKVVARLLDGGLAPQLGIDVIDTGIGVDPSRLDSIFDPFTQADATITRQFGGTGLGLAISRRFAEAMGGTLTATSRPGQGSTFSVTLDTGPLDGIPRLDERQWREQHRQASRGAEAIPKSLNGARVLVVDDGEANRRLIQLVLSRAGAVVEEATNGQEAVDRVGAEPFDVILMDMQMPIMDGYTATTRLRESGVKQPIIALTANAMKGDEDKCRAAGCSGFLPKPVDLDELIRVVSAEMLGRDFDLARPESIMSPEVRPVAPATPDPALQGPAPAITEPTMVPPVLPLSPDTTEIPADVPLSARDRAAWGLPTDDEAYRRVMRSFVATLEADLAGVRQAWARRDLDAIAQRAHSIKGSGGTFGFHNLSAAAGNLEQFAERREMGGVETALDEVEALSARIVDRCPDTGATTCSCQTDGDRCGTPDLGTMPETPPSAGADVVQPAVPAADNSPATNGAPLRSSLPVDDPEFRRIVVDFVARLGEQLASMDDAWQRTDLDEMARLAHWLKGAGGTVGFGAFTQPARDLEQAAKNGDSDELETILRELKELAASIEVSSTGTLVPGG